MNRKVLLATLMSIFMACNFLFPPAAAEPKKEQPTKVNLTSDTELMGFTTVRLHPEDGDLQTLLAAEAHKAIALGQMPVVEFDATWCPPCKAIEEALNEKNELMLKAYDGTYIIKLDVDEWGWSDSSLHDFDFTGIPVYFKLDAQGQRAGDVIDGDAWGDNIPENMAPPMDTFFHGN